MYFACIFGDLRSIGLNRNTTEIKKHILVICCQRGNVIRAGFGTEHAVPFYNLKTQIILTVVSVSLCLRTCLYA